ncbi:MAG: ribosome maturation factor RimM [Gammaproteobacteria bacterium]|jgi:16S rRNA processing protein RimM
MEETDSQFVVVGKITSAYGVKGWVKVFSYTDPVSNILQYTPWYLPDSPKHNGWRRCELVNGRLHGKQLVAQLEGVNDRNQAELLRGTDIAVPRSQLPEPEEGEYYWLDLKGLRVVNTHGVELGVVDDMMETGANDVLVVKGDRQRLIPYVMDEIVKDVNLAGGVLTVDWEPDY